ncbi:hypothetical protein [Methylomonas albis]|uniref:Uncharacterized protein n=1 Tax=Methylomonas albis TaxID=1854563 RepID=A0ABR9CXI7_9GAMM|nr:hypothetical protein [Methylomonas albis]MBD9354382.1 hypothetical protein [Methylomonas albis]
MSIQAHIAGFTFSTVTLSYEIWFWSDLFLFSKTVHLPNWTYFLPSPIDAPKYIAFLCLIPLVLTSKTQRMAWASVGISLLISPIPTLIDHFLDLRVYGQSFIGYVILNYFWVILFDCFIPAFLLLVVRALLFKE